MATIKLAADFNDFLKLCLRHKVQFLVIGGYAVIHHSRPRYTGDLDLWVGASLWISSARGINFHDYGS